MDEFPDAPIAPRTFPLKRIAIHLLLFVLTLFTTTLAGVQWLTKDPFDLSNFSYGLPYAVALCLMLATHEFGHYFAARYHRVDATLPFFLPFPAFPLPDIGILNPFGTFGAIIRLRSPMPSRKVLFDIGAAGPLAGFVVSAAVLAYGFMTLPPVSYLYSIHPEYAQMASIPESGLRFGTTLLYGIFGKVFAPSGAFIPPMNEMYHYPFLCVGWFGMFVTAMNLIPIGQLDGGHISYAMFGKRYHMIAQVFLVFLALVGLAGFLALVGIQIPFGYPMWLLWVFLLVLVMRRIGLNRPPLGDETPLDPGRMILGWTCWVIFVGSFSLTPLIP